MIKFVSFISVLVLGIFSTIFAYAAESVSAESGAPSSKISISMPSLRIGSLKVEPNFAGMLSIGIKVGLAF